MKNIIKKKLSKLSLNEYCKNIEILIQRSKELDAMELDKNLENVTVSKLRIETFGGTSGIGKIRTLIKSKICPTVIWFKDLNDRDRSQILVGWTCIDFQSKMMEIYVDKRYRNKGIGGKIMDRAVNLYNAQSIRINNNDPDLERFVRKYGFTKFVFKDSEKTLLSNKYSNNKK